MSRKGKQKRRDSTLVLLTLNEIDGLELTWDDLPIDEFKTVLAVDGGSTDGSREFLQARGVPILDQPIPGRGVAFRVAAEAMRRILINRARDKGRLKRGGGRRRLDLECLESALECPDEELLAVNEALEKLAQEDALSAELVKLRFFAGLSQGDASRALGLARRTADRCWSFARTWLCRRTVRR